MAINNSPRRDLNCRDPQVSLIGVCFPVTSAYAKAELDMSTCNAQMDNVLQAHVAGVGGNSIRVKVIGDSAPAAGVTIDVSGNDVTIHFESGVSTQGDVNTAIAALAGADDIVDVKTAGTVGTVLVNGRACTDCALYCDSADGFDTWIRAGFNTGLDGAKYRVALVGDASANAGSAEVLDLESGGKLLLLHFKDTGSTVADMEALIAALSPADFEVMTAGSAANDLQETTEGGGDVIGDSQAFLMGRSEPFATATHAEQDFTALSGGTGFGTVTPTGDTDAVESVTHTAVGTYLVTLREQWPQLLCGKAAFQSAAASAYQAKLGAYSRANRTLYVTVWDTNGAALADPTPAAGTQVGLLLWLGNSGVGIIPK